MHARLMTLLLFTAILTSASGLLAQPEQGKPVSIAQSYTLESKILAQTRTLNVYLPPGYSESDKSYPALFLLDGGIKEDFLHIVGLASLAADFRNIREFIVIGIEDIDRRHDFTAPSKVPRDNKELPTAGGSAAFREFLAQELKPFVAKHFRLTDETVLIGESAAGLFVTETFLRQPDLFGGYIAISPSLWWDDQSLAKEAAALLQQKSFPANRRLYLTIGSEGSTMLGGVKILVRALKKHARKDLVWTYDPMPHEEHGTIFHPAALKAIRLFFATEKKYTY